MNLELWKQRKKELHLTIDEIAIKANLPKGSVQNIFAGYIQDPRNSTVEAIEKALGLNQSPEWTEEDKAAGVGKHTVNLSSEEWEWLELRSDIINAKGEEYYKTFVTLIRGLLK